MNRLLLTGAALAAVPASAEVFYGTYTPSQNDVVIASTLDPWIYELRDHDSAASATTQTASESAYRVLNVFGTNISRQFVYNEFVAPNAFDATHISVAVSRTFLASDTLMGVSVQQWDEGTETWGNLYTTFGGARLRAAGIPQTGEIFDMILPFGNNPTGSPDGFSSTPATIEAGERYRIVLSHSAGAVGGMNWHLSNMLADSDAVGFDNDPATGPGSSAYYEGFNANNNTSYMETVDYQFAFAFTDGDPVPAPASAVLLGLGGFVAGRRRR